jgi:hypothetical protein
MDVNMEYFTPELWGKLQTPETREQANVEWEKTVKLIGRYLII